MHIVKRIWETVALFSNQFLEDTGLSEYIMDALAALAETVVKGMECISYAYY